jgi:hypothetical protein
MYLWRRMLMRLALGFIFIVLGGHVGLGEVLCAIASSGKLVAAITTSTAIANSLLIIIQYSPFDLRNHRNDIAIQPYTPIFPLLHLRKRSNS